MTSFEADRIERTEGHMSNFYVQGQLYHNIGSAYNNEQETPKFMEIYFMDGGYNAQGNIRGKQFKSLNKELLCPLSKFFEEQNLLLEK